MVDLLDGGWASGLPPLPKKGHHALNTFNEWAASILVEWDRLQLDKPARRAESPNAWFKREAYRLIKHYVDYDLLNVVRRNISGDKRPVRLVEDALKNPFKLGLLGMFSDDDMMNKSNRHVFGNQMLYAWLHEVPPEFLNAFLAVSGSPNIIAAKLRDRSIEPGFEQRYRGDRVIAR